MIKFYSNLSQIYVHKKICGYFLPLPLKPMNLIQDDNNSLIWFLFNRLIHFDWEFDFFHLVLISFQSVIKSKPDSEIKLDIMDDWLLGAVGFNFKQIAITSKNVNSARLRLRLVTVRVRSVLFLLNLNCSVILLC